VRLCHGLLRKVIPERNLTETKKLLIGSGVVECDRAWAPGKAYGYRLTDDYRQTAVVVCDDKSFSAKVRGLYARQERDLQPVHRALREDLDRVVFDMDGARSVIATLKPKKKKRRVPYTTAQYRQDLLLVAAVLAEGDHYLEVDGYGRVHTTVTSLPKRLLPCLRLKDENDVPRPVVRLDLSNSQPLMVGILSRNYLHGSAAARHRTRKAAFGKGDPYQAADQALRAGPVNGESRSLETGKPPNQAVNPRHATPSPKPNNTAGNQPTAAAASSRLTTQHDTPPLYEPEKAVRGRASKGLAKEGPETMPDVRQYLRLCERGQIYEALRRPGEDRNRVKLRLLCARYRNPKAEGRFPNGMWRRLCLRFPSVARVLTEVKEKDYRRAAWLMQNYESTVFIKRVCGRIKKERPGVPLLTWHDCVGTIPEHAE
jgi:hypothetical protein